MDKGNIYKQIPGDLSKEVFEGLAEGERVRVERIISKGHSSPDSGWYDQELNEWVLVLQGEASIAFEGGSLVKLERGDYINIAAHQKHRVVNTSRETETIWLAIHYV